MKPARLFGIFNHLECYAVFDAAGRIKSLYFGKNIDTVYIVNAAQSHHWRRAYRIEYAVFYVHRYTKYI